MKKTFAIFASLMVMASISMAGVKYAGADASPAFAIKNSGSVTATIKVDVSGLTNTVTIGAVSVAFTGASYDTIAELAVAINAFTNAAGETPLTFVPGYSLAADSIDQELLSGTYTITAGATTEVPWDTSACLFYSQYVPSGNLTSVTCTPTGSGAIALKIYEAGTLVYNAAVDTNTVGVVEKSWSGGLGTTGRVLVRVTLASSATTGNISVGFTPSGGK